MLTCLKEVKSVSCFFDNAFCRITTALRLPFPIICDLACFFLCEVSTKKSIDAYLHAQSHKGNKIPENRLKSCFLMVCEEFLKTDIGERVFEQSENGL